MTHLSEPLTPARLSEIRDGAIFVGGSVRLVSDSAYLRNYHLAIPGVIGTVIAFSPGTNGDEDGALIDWGDGKPVRSPGHEFEAHPVPDLLAEVYRLTAALDAADKAPHEEDCTSNWFPSCTCWKSEYEATKEALS